MKILLVLSLCVLHSALAITFNSPFSIPANDYTVLTNADGTYTISLTQSGWVSSDVVTMNSVDASFFVTINAATATASAGIILISAEDGDNYRFCGTNPGYNSQPSLVGIADEGAPCGLADIVTIYEPARPGNSSSVVTTPAALNVPVNFQYNFYEGQPCLEVVILGVQTVNQGGNCDPGDPSYIDSDESRGYALYLEVEQGGVATFTIGTGFACPANCTTCSSYNNCTTCAPGNTLNGTQCVPTPTNSPAPTKPKPTCDPSCPLCYPFNTIAAGKNLYYQCLRCPFGKYLNSNKYQCSACPVNCTLCTSATTCQLCAAGYQPVGGQCLKAVCSPTCAYCDFTQALVPFLDGPLGAFLSQYAYYVCSACPKGYYVKPNKCECQSCPSQCATCNGASLCTSCVSGYYLKNYQCIRSNH